MMPKGPGHNNLPAQNSEAPYNFTLSSNTIPSNGKVEFSISQKPGGPQFAGYMVHVRVDKSSPPLGTFQPKGENAGTATCSNENDTGSHIDPNPKDKITLIWEPPHDFKGLVNFYATVAESRLKFWVFQKVGTLEVQ